VATYDRPKAWPRWSGTLGELQQAAEMAVREVREWTNREPEVSITVTQKDGFTTSPDDPSELSEAVDQRDLSRIKSLMMLLGSYGGNARVEIRLSGGFSGEGLSLSVRGRDKTRVEGLAQRLSEILTPRHSVGVPGLHGVRGMLVVVGSYVVTLAVMSLITGSLILGLDPGTVRASIVLGAGGLAVALTALAMWAGPALEILAPGQRPRFVRWRARLLAILGAAVVGIATSIVATLIYNGN
jgi:hypothetical protein